MRLPLTLAALLTATLAAGCLGGAGETMTARQGLGDALSAAEAWSDGEDLELIGVVAVEPFKRMHHESDDGDYEAEYVTHLDGNPGDGRAPGWAYGFSTGERCVSIVLAAGIGVLAEGYETCHGDDDTLPEWSVDSDEVAEILKGEDEWPDLGEDGTYFWALSNDDGDAVWTVGGSGEDGETAFGVVDAETGEVLAIVHEADGIDGFFEAEPEAGAHMEGSDSDTDSSAAMAAGDELVAEVELDGMGRIDVQVSANAIVDSLRLTVEGPYGVVAEDDLGGLATGMSQQGRSYDDLPAGHYTVTVSVEGAALLASLDVQANWANW